MGPASLAYRPDIQGIRAVAVLSVIAAHLSIPGFAGGFVGVDVFFVLSGYLITGLLLKEQTRNGAIRLVEFWARRLKRLLPALAISLVASALIAKWLLTDAEFLHQTRSLPYAATWTSNLYFLFRNLDYFDELAANDLFLHTWSLGVEEQFYILWPLFLAAAYYFGLKDPENHRIRLFRWLLVAILASFCFSLYSSYVYPRASFYLMPSRIWQFSLGGMIFLMAQKSPQPSQAGKSLLEKHLGQILIASGLLLVLSTVVFLDENVPYPGYWALYPSLGTALLLLSGMHLKNGQESILAKKGLIWIGDRSYSLYLWHWPIIILSNAFFLAIGPIQLFGIILLCFLLADLSYRYVEIPFWRGALSSINPRLSILLAALLMASIVLLGVRLAPPNNYVMNETSSTNWRADVPEIYRMPCDAWYSHSRVEPCIFTSDKARKRVLLLGDSIGAQWFSMIRETFPHPEWEVVVLTKSACAIADVDYFYPRIGRMYDVCSKWRDRILQSLDQFDADVAVIGNALSYDFTDEQWVEGSRAVFSSLSSSIDSVLVIPGTPRLGLDGPSCVERYHLAGDSPLNDLCKGSGDKALAAHVTDLLEIAAESFPNVAVVNLNDLVCPGGICSAINGEGIVVFRDSQHLTDTFVRFSARVAGDRLLHALPAHHQTGSALKED